MRGPYKVHVHGVQGLSVSEVYREGDLGGDGHQGETPEEGAP